MKKLFGVRPKLSYYKVFHRKFISNRNEKTKTNKQTKKTKKTEILISKPSIQDFQTFNTRIQ